MLSKKEYYVAENHRCTNKFINDPVRTLKEALDLAQSMYGDRCSGSIIIEKYYHDGYEDCVYLSYDEACNRLYNDPDIIVLDKALLSDSPFS